MNDVNTSNKNNKGFANKLSKFFNRDYNPTKYVEIFSTSENKLNTKNTNPLEIDNSQTTVKTNLSTKNISVETVENNSTAQKKKKNFTSNILNDLFKVYPEYTKRQNAKIIREILKKEIKSIKIKLFILTFIFLLSLSLDLLMRTYPSLLSMYIPINSLLIYLSASLLLLLLSFAVGFKIIKTAFVHMFSATFSPESALVLPVTATLINCVLSLIFFNTSASPHIFVGLFILNLIFILLNSLITKERILNNLKFATSFKQKYNVDTYSLNNILPNTYKQKNLLTAYQCKTSFLSNFLRNSYSISITDVINSKFILCGVIFSIFCFFISIILNKNLILSLSAFNISTLICIPVTLSLCANSVVSSLCKNTLKNKAMVIGENSIKKLSKVKSVVLNDSDLYPANNVILRGIKTFNGQRIDEAILSAAAVVCSLSAPISHVFDKIIMGKRTILTTASDVVYKDNKGVVGWVNGQRILVGNRELLKEYKIGPPSRDYEDKHRSPSCELTYFAVGHDLVAMFILEYLPSQSLYETLYSCIKNNITIYVKTVDSNISTKKIACDFDIDEKNIVLLSFDESQTINDFCDKPIEKSRASIATFGSVSSLLKTVCSCIHAENNIKLSISIQIIELLLSIILISALIFCFGISELHNIELIIYVLSWFILTIIASKIKKLI